MLVIKRKIIKLGHANCLAIPAFWLKYILLKRGVKPTTLLVEIKDEEMRIRPYFEEENQNEGKV